MVKNVILGEMIAAGVGLSAAVSEFLPCLRSQLKCKLGRGGDRYGTGDTQENIYMELGKDSVMSNCFLLDWPFFC